LEKGSACARDIRRSSTTIAIAGRMPICHPAGPAGRAEDAVEFSIGEQYDIRGRHEATKLERQTLIEVKPHGRMRV